MNYELYHHGILGMKWGIRRYQNKDGSLTEAGRKRLAKNAANVSKRERELARAKWYNRDKAREKRDRALDKHESFIKRLNYNTMSDEEILKSIKNFRANEAVSAVVTSSNVQRGERTLEQKVSLLNSIFGMGSSAVSLMSSIRDFGWRAKDREQKQAEEEKRKNQNPNQEKDVKKTSDRKNPSQEQKKRESDNASKKVEADRKKSEADKANRKADEARRRSEEATRKADEARRRSQEEAKKAERENQRPFYKETKKTESEIPKYKGPTEYTTSKEPYKNGKIIDVDDYEVIDWYTKGSGSNAESVALIPYSAVSGGSSTSSSTDLIPYSAVEDWYKKFKG
ncbi:MAG: hypothetical protein II038_00940 [Lachnospiraceae bacterium]|nr:hypothetical protein [Lachnospiraceae bacterium]